MLGQLAHNLPAPRTSLIGREDDTSRLCEIILHGRERLVTLTGVGGCGKTRLAIHVASELRPSFPDGVWLVELASVSDPRLLPEVVAAALGIREKSETRAQDILAASLGARSVLLLLDNCEHLVEACANLTDHLLSSCPNLRILATSREPLQVAGERQYRVLPLSVPGDLEEATAEELTRYPSVQLFVERAGAAELNFRLTAANAATVARICNLLDGIPLALELAAARVRVLSVGQIVGRLDDCFQMLAGSSRSAPTRQQTLRGALDWSYNLLIQPEQTALRRLSVFVGGWDVEAAEEICCLGEGMEAVDALEVLTRLVDKSLVVVEEIGGEARYRLLEPVRQYAMRRLTESGEAKAAREAQAAYYVGLAERAEPEFYGPEQAAWLQRIDRELDNIRAVMRWAEERGDVETPLRLAGSLRWYFWMRRHLREGLRWLEGALARGAQASPQARARALSGGAVVCSFLGEYPKGLAFGREALAIQRQLDDTLGQAWTNITLAHITLDQGDLPESRSLGEEGLALARKCGLRWTLGHALTVLAETVRRQGDTERAVALYEEALAIFREHGDKFGIGMVTYALAAPAEEGADFKLPAAAATINLYWERGDRAALADAIEYLAGRGKPGRAEVQVRLFAAAQTLRRSLGILPPPGERQDVERHMASARAELGESRFAAAWEEGCALSLEQVVASVLGGEPPSHGLAVAPPAARGHVPGQPDALTRREREVARLLALGYTDRQIADELIITEGTAGIHVHHILEKLRLRSRVQVVDWAIAHGLIDRQPG